MDKITRFALRCLVCIQWLIETVEKGKTAELLETYNSATAKAFCHREIDPAPEVRITHA